MSFKSFPINIYFFFFRFSSKFLVGERERDGGRGDREEKRGEREGEGDREEKREERESERERERDRDRVSGCNYKKIKYNTFSTFQPGSIKYPTKKRERIEQTTFANLQVLLSTIYSFSCRMDNLIQISVSNKLHIHINSL